MYSPVLSVPPRRVSGWVAETDPKYARAWLGTLPLANSAESAREIYQALYTVNRLELRVAVRLELMELYEHAVASVCTGLQSHLLHAVPPLGPKRRQLAEFIRRLHVEMAYGYKCALRELSRARLPLRRKSRSAVCLERALYHLGEVLLRSYLVYLPYPPNVWREMHELYRAAESLGIVDEALETENQVAYRATIGERYVRTLLLGLINPYQLPHGTVQQVDAFLGRWSGQVGVMTRDLALRELTRDVNGCFRIDLATDAPPVPLAKSSQALDDNARVLDARALLQTVQGFVIRLEKGEDIERLGLGVDCLDSACMDMLHRMVRAWGETARRRYARRQQSSNVFICIGLNALHFFLNGQRPFATYLQAFPEPTAISGAGAASDIAFIELDRIEEGIATDDSPATALAASIPVESHRVDRWQLRDVGPQGMAVVRNGDAALPTRVGDLVGVQQPRDLGRWRAAVIRWVKTPEADSIEAGVELLAPAVLPVAIRLPENPTDGANVFPALRLPATEVMRRPSMLLLPRGLCQIADELELLEEEAEPRRVRLLRLIERTGAFEQVVYGELVARVRRGR